MPAPSTIQDAAREKPPVFHPLAGANFITFWRHYLSNNHFDSRSLTPRTTAAACSLVRTPVYTYKKLRCRRAIQTATPSAPPVFIVGHWRSGTTHLHNILSQDPQFAWITLHQTSNPWSMAGPGSGLVRFLMQKVLPETRGMDNIPISLDSPQEEEMALGNMNPLSYFNCYYFPQRFRHHFNRSVLLENISPAERSNFASAYRLLVRKLAFANDNKRILFKNPPSTARIQFLKETFPGARFIHIVRNPFTVFASTLAHYPRILNAFAWQKFDDLDFESITMENYRRLMQAFVEQKKSFSPDELLETSLEKIQSSPLEEISRIYDTFDIPGKEPALNAIRPYLDSLKDYRQNPHTLTATQVDRVRSQWNFALQHWNYDLPHDLPITP